MSDYISGLRSSDFRAGDRVLVDYGFGKKPGTVYEVENGWVRVNRDDGQRDGYLPSCVSFEDPLEVAGEDYYSDDEEEEPQPEGKTLLEKLHAAYVEHDGVRAEMASLREELASARVEIEALRKALEPLLERS